jgi:hypothetical protein
VTSPQFLTNRRERTLTDAKITQKSDWTVDAPDPRRKNRRGLAEDCKADRNY